MGPFVRVRSAGKLCLVLDLDHTLLQSVMYSELEPSVGRWLEQRAAVESLGKMEQRELFRNDAIQVNIIVLLLGMRRSDFPSLPCASKLSRSNHGSFLPLDHSSCATPFLCFVFLHRCIRSYVLESETFFSAPRSSMNYGSTPTVRNSFLVQCVHRCWPRIFSLVAHNG